MEKLIIDALIEIPSGSQNKYEVDKVNNRIILDRPLYSAMLYPAEYGYVENTLALDNDPIDILVFTSFSTFPGCTIESRVLGMLEMEDSGEEDVKLIAVNNRDPRFDHVNSLDDLPPHYLEELRHFFDTYKQLQHKKVTTGEFLGVEEAKVFLDDAIKRFQDLNK